MAHEHKVLVLQGGGALGAYQAGVYEGMAECGFVPDWVAGVSIGAINGALIAGNPPERRLERLREFWNRVSSGLPLNPLAPLAQVRGGLNRVSALASALFGVPGFFSPRIPPAPFAPDGTPGALSVYDTSPLRRTLAELVDFDFLNNAQRIRLSVGAVNVRSGNSIYFDNRSHELRVEHLMASGSLPPGFPPVLIDGEHYWDGGIVSNSPLWQVLDDSPTLNAFILQVDLFGARREITIAHLINRRFAHSANSKDYEFSRSTVRELWQCGLDDLRRAREQRAWLEAQEVESGVRVIDLSRRSEEHTSELQS